MLTSLSVEQFSPELQAAHAVFWQRFVVACEQSTQLDNPQTLLDKCLQREELPYVWMGSAFIANSCIACPPLLQHLLDSGDLDRGYQPEELEQSLRIALQGVEEESLLQEKMRDFRRREMVRIAWRDLSRMADLRQTMLCLSELADSCIRQAFAFHLDKLKQRYGTPRGRQGNEAFMVVLALGKLGGRELNFSSDVDLMFAYSEWGETDGAQKQLDNQSFFTKLGKKIIATLDTPLHNGIVFRTDMRLRPNGDSGRLVLSFSAMEDYYQTHGRSWERYALVKARGVAGERQSSAALLALLKPFVYRKYIDFGVFDAIRKMKEMIEQELNRKGHRNNVKLGKGGIREVEFLVQCRQLLSGGRVQQLQTESFYLALQGLAQLDVVSPQVAEKLRLAYDFLRDTEHRLQMVDDQQTHRLPHDEVAIKRLALTMGFDEVTTYLSCLQQHQDFIHQKFHSILNFAQSEQQSTLDKQVSDVWIGNMSDSAKDDILQKIGFQKTEHVRQLLQGLRHSRLYRSYANIDRDRLDKLMPLAMRQAASLNDPNRALTEFVSIVEEIGRRSSYLVLLVESPVALKQLLQLCEASPLISSHIGKHPVILDELLQPIIGIKEQDKKNMHGRLQRRLQQGEQGEEQRMNIVREFQKAQILRIASADISGALQTIDIQRAITELAEILLQSELQEATAQVTKKLGEPDCEVGIVAYGKLATAELGYNSDLDIVVCYDQSNTGDSSNQVYFYSRVARRFINLLTMQTSAGRLFEIDMRLRPEGSRGTLVTSLSAFENYQMNSAWTWEHQALVRSRVVVGSPHFRQKFEAIRQSVLSLRRDETELKQQVVAMRRKMIDANCQSDNHWYDIKLDVGGMVDIEFLAQYWLLLHCHEQPLLAKPRRTGEILLCLAQQKLIADELAARLQYVYERYLQRLLYLKLMDKPALISDDELRPERRTITSIWQQVFE